MGAYPLHKASAEQLLLFHAGKALAIDPACLIATVTIVAGITGNPACFPLAIHAPIVRAYFSTAVINRTAKLMPVRISRGQTVFPVSPLCPEFTENKAILAPLNQISIVLFCPNIPGAPQGFEYNGMPAAGTASFLIVIWMPGYRDLFPTKGTITVLGSAAFIAIEDEIFPHSHLINPAHPILGQFRHLSQILIPRAGNSFMPLLQLFVPYISLKIKDTEITAAFPTKIVLYYGSIFLTGPAGGIIVSPRPIQPVQFGVPPFFL